MTQMFRMTADLPTFRRNSRALCICGVLLTVLSFVPWVDRYQNITAPPTVLNYFHPSSHVQQFIPSEQLVIGTPSTSHIRGYEVDRTFPVADGIVLTIAAALMAMLAFLGWGRTPKRQSALLSLAIACSFLVLIGFVTVFPNWRQEGISHWEQRGTFELRWETAAGVFIASLVLLFAAAKVANMWLIALRRRPE